MNLCAWNGPELLFAQDASRLTFNRGELLVNRDILSDVVSVLSSYNQVLSSGITPFDVWSSVLVVKQDGKNNAVP